MIKALSNFDDVNSGDLLNFYGSLLSFIGTIVLGVVASHQSWKANRLSERLLKIEEERYLPIVDIQEVMQLPSELADDTYNNSMQISLNDSEFYFNKKNDIEFCIKPIYVFALKNICSNHIISVNIDKIIQNTKFDNEKVMTSKINTISFNGGIRVLGNDESQYFMISGIQHEFPDGLSTDEALSQGYTNRVTELIIKFELTNVKGQKFYEVIRISFFSAVFRDSKLYYPSIVEKEILSIMTVK